MKQNTLTVCRSWGIGERRFEVAGFRDEAKSEKAVGYELSAMSLERFLIAKIKA